MINFTLEKFKEASSILVPIEVERGRCNHANKLTPQEAESVIYIYGSKWGESGVLTYKLCDNCGYNHLVSQYEN
jgi:hypothetical protein